MMNHLISKGYDIHFCSMGSDRKYTSIFMGVLHHVQHIVYYFIMINNVCPFPYGILFYWWSVPFPVENINCYLHTWPDSVCPLIIKYIPTKSLSWTCDLIKLVFHGRDNSKIPFSQFYIQKMNKVFSSSFRSCYILGTGAVTHLTSLT